MRFIDFEYDKYHLSDFGFIVCDFNYPNGAATSNEGAELKLKTVPRRYGRSHSKVGSSYDNCLTASFDICKNPDVYDVSEREISDDEYRDIVRWLNRNKFIPFRAIDDTCQSESCWFKASFNTAQIRIAETLYGVHLTMETDAPFGFGQQLTFKKVLGSGQSITVYDMSDDIGFFCPYVSVKVLGNKDGAQIESDLTGTVTTFKHLYENETIEMNGNTMIVESTFAPVNRPTSLTDDFNYDFVAIGNEYDNRVNNLTVNFSCEITISYSPIIKNII